MKVHSPNPKEIQYTKRILQQIFRGIEYDGLNLLSDIVSRKLYKCFISTNNGLIYIELEKYVGVDDHFIMRISNTLITNVLLEVDHLDNEKMVTLFDWVEDWKMEV